ncbi:MAG: arginyl-tRNA--protein-N-Asp/Glu arginylyltransferase [Saprospiraceae bacterium]|jgi:arginyl-tRNA--protein-N-Asp/Glu arginylyltransferase
MRLIFSELPPLYNTYTFPHAVYAVAEAGDLISSIYNQGFLPYSADLKKKSSVFYLARSLRIDLSNFVDSSENRRVDRKMEIGSVRVRNIPIKEYDIEDQGFLNFCESYILERFPAGAMPMERFKYILNNDLTTHILEFSGKNGALLGIIITSQQENMMHYWFAFFDNSFRENAPIGKWIMWQSIRWAKEETLDYIYLGTCYESKSLYKVRDFKGVEFFDGEVWNADLKELKRRVREDSEVWNMDRWRKDNFLPE